MPSPVKRLVASGHASPSIISQVLCGCTSADGILTVWSQSVMCDFMQEGQRFDSYCYDESFKVHDVRLEVGDHTDILTN